MIRIIQSKSKREFLLCFLIIFTSNVFSQEWTWIKGANTLNSLGVYGTQGTSAAGNLAGSREGAATWTDNSGNLWMFGGNGHCSFGYGRLNDLWKLDASTQNWTWVGGVDSYDQWGTFGTQGTAAGSNIPSGRAYACTWVDNSGNLWMLGGYGIGSAGGLDHLNDLWKYNFGTGQWTWMKGSNILNQAGIYGTLGVASATNAPGARRNSVSWKDNSGNLWLFGGYGYDVFGNAGHLNDLWKYDPSGNTWTWVSGSNIINQVGVYGTISVATSTNVPGARYGAVSWKDSGGNLWLFGGSGYASSTTGYLNDVWKYNVSTNQWAWVKGSNVENQSSYYETPTIPSATNTPGGRFQCAKWTDNSDYIYIQGGVGYTTPSYAMQLNDMWRYTVSTNQWTWIRGANYEVAGVYGSQSVTATSSDPGSGPLRASWRDNSGNFWLFGGNAYDVNANYGVMGDLWKMNTCVAPAPVNTTSFIKQNPCTGSSATLSAVSNTNTVNWYSLPTGGTSLGTGTNYVTTSLSSGTMVTSSFTFYASATNTCGTSLVRTPIIVTSNSIYPTVTTGSVYTVTLSIPYGSTGVSDWSPWIYNFTDPVPAGGIIIGMDLSCDVVDQGWGGTGAGASMQVADQTIAYPTLYHSWASHSFTNTAPFPNYVYGGTNSFKMYFVGWGGWQGFINNANIVIRYQYKPSSPLYVCGNSTLALKAYGATTYSWTGSAIDGAVFTPTLSQTYTVVGYNDYGCTNAAVQQVSLMATPTVAIPGNTTICSGQSLSQTATLTGSSHTFSWSTGSTATTISSSPTISTRYTAIAMNTLTGCFHSISRKINVNPLPTSSVSVSNSVVCAGVSTSLAVTTSSSAYGLSFDGIDDYVETNLNITELGKADFSIEAWIKTTGVSEGILVCENSSYGWDLGEKAFYLDASGVPIFVGNSCNYIRGNVAVNDGLWHHVAVVWDYATGTSGVGKIYVDGADHTGVVDFYAATYNLGTFKIGATNYNGYTPEAPNNFSGTIDDVRIWNTARSLSQISTNLNTCLTGFETGLVAYYNFEDGSGSPTLADRSSNEAHGALTNMNTLSAWTAGNNNCPGTFVSYAWSPGSATSQSISATPTITTVYTVNITNNLSCSNSHVQTVSVNPLPSVGGNSGAVCTGGSYTIIPSGAATYTFLNGGTIVSPASNTTYSIIGTSAAGCISSTPGLVNITVNSLPVLSITGASAVCSGSAISQTVNGADTYSWSTGSTSSLISVNPSVTTTYYVTGTNSLTGCSASLSKAITLSYPPVISVNSGNICAGSTFTMVPFGASTYTFSDGTSTVSSTVSPMSNTSYYVSGTSTAGCVSTGSAVSNVLVNAAPVIVPNSGGVCIGSGYTLSPSGASTYTFYNSSGTITPFVSPVATTNYSIMGTNILGCVSLIPGIASITVNPLPVISVTNGTVCLGSPFTIIPTGASTYTYSSGNIVTPTSNTNYSVTGTSSAGCVSSTPAVITVSTVTLPVISLPNGTVCIGSTYTLSPNGASTYTYSSGTPYVVPLSNTTYTVIGRAANGCMSSNFATANVTVLPVPYISVTDGTICAGQVFTMNPTGAFTYSFSSLSATVNPSVTTSYSVTGTNSLGCVSSNVAISNVIVKPLPSVAAVGNTIICSGKSTSLIAIGASSYTWNTSLFGYTQTFSPSATNQYTLQGTGANGCIKTLTFNITVNPLPTVTLNTGTICPLSSFTINPSGALNYNYSSGSNVVAPGLTTTYSVSGTDANGCISLPAVTTITVINSITVSVSGNTVVCLGESANLTGTGASSYTWSTQEQGSSISPSPTVSSVYSVIGANGTCMDTVNIAVTVNPLPLVPVSMSSSVICFGESATISVSGNDSYVWNTAETTSEILVSPTVTSQYTVTATDVNGCKNIAVATQTVNECTGLKSNQTGILGYVTSVYPNPNNGEFYIESVHPLEMRILNVLGEAILETSIHEGRNTITLHEQTKGIYFIELKIEEHTRTIKVIKQ